MVESEDEEEENDGVGGGGDDGDDDGDDDDMDNIPLSVSLLAMGAQSSMLAGGLATEDVAVEDISDSPEEVRDVALVQPRTEPIPYP